ncbi:hypothetical protein E9993_03610 [Labilibacter sediminis]|nr:hypothetical protein E9993_03610 [Labilibacter sediminis]
MSTKTKLHLCILLLTCSTSHAQSLYYRSPSSIGMGGTGITQTDVWSAILNPAGTTHIKNSSFATGYLLPYFTQELSHKSIIATLPTKLGVISSSLNHFGYRLYHETQINFNYARSITPNFSFSFSLHIQNNHIANTGSGQQVYSGIGILYNISENLSFGTTITNPEKTRIKIGEEKIEIPTFFITGLSWKPNSTFTINTELEKQSGLKSLVKLGLNYNIHKQIWIKTGILGKPVNYTMGMGVKFNDLKIDTGISHDQTLGISSGIGLSFVIPENK